MARGLKWKQVQRHLRIRRQGQIHSVLAGFLGWTLDAFDFFIVVFLFDTLAKQFGVTKKDIVLTTTVTLAMRPWARCCSVSWRTDLGAASR